MICPLLLDIQCVPFIDLDFVLLLILLSLQMNVFSCSNESLSLARMCSLARMSSLADLGKFAKDLFVLTELSFYY